MRLKQTNHQFVFHPSSFWPIGLTKFQVGQKSSEARTVCFSSSQPRPEASFKSRIMLNFTLSLRRSVIKSMTVQSIWFQNQKDNERLTWAKWFLIWSRSNWRLNDSFKSFKALVQTGGWKLLSAVFRVFVSSCKVSSRLRVWASVHFAGLLAVLTPDFARPIFERWTWFELVDERWKERWWMNELVWSFETSQERLVKRDRSREIFGARLRGPGRTQVHYVI